MADILDFERFRRRRALQNIQSSDNSILCDDTLEDITSLHAMIERISNVETIPVLGINPDRLDYLVYVADEILTHLENIGYFEQEVETNDND